MKNKPAQGRAPAKPAKGRMSLSIKYLSLSMSGDEAEVRDALATFGQALSGLASAAFVQSCVAPPFGTHPADKPASSDAAR